MSLPASGGVDASEGQEIGHAEVTYGAAAGGQGGTPVWISGGIRRRIGAEQTKNDLGDDAAANWSKP